MQKYEEILKSENVLLNNLSKIIIFLIIGILFFWSAFAIDSPNVPDGGIQIAKNIMIGIFTPSTDLIFSLNAESVIYLIIETIMIAFLGTLIGALIAILFAFLGSNNLTHKYISGTIKTMLGIIRTVPTIIYGIIIIKVVGMGAFAGVLTFAIVSIGMVSKMYIEDIEEISSGLKETAEVAGLTWIANVRLVVIPQILNSIFSIFIYRFEINLRDVVILGLIGGGGLGVPLYLAISESRWNDVGAYLLGLIILVLVVEVLSTKIRTKLTRG